MKAIILAGGSGTRLWPMSRSSKPKQFFDVVGSEPLICDTYQRLLRFFPAEKIYFSITPVFEATLVKYFPELEPSRIIVEPEKRDTGPAMGYVAALLELEDPDEPMVFIPSDHYIADEEKFLNCLAVGEKLILETGKMVDIGIAPTFPSTVLGYTKFGALIEKRDNAEVYEFAGHTEKPPREIAEQYLAAGNFLWHANYYMWTPRKFMEAFETYAPEMAEILRAGRERYSELPKISFDYAITEKMNPSEVLILKGDFGWSDIGAWDTLFDRLAENEKQNVVKGSTILVETEGSLVYAPEGKTVAVLGMKDAIVVDTGDALLVCPRSEAQRVKEIISELQKNNLENLL